MASGRTAITISAVGAAAFVAGFGLDAVLTPGTSDPGPAPTVTVTESSAATQQPAPATKRQTVLDAKGTGYNTTSRFTVTGDWDLEYTYTCPDSSTCVLNISYDDGHGGGDTVIDEQTHGRTGVTHEHAGGAFTLGIRSDADWTLKVVQLRA